MNSANPAALVTNYKQIAAAGKQLLRTDIPADILQAFIELGLKVKNANVANVDLDKSKNFPSGQNPKYEAMRELVQKAIQPKTLPVASTPSKKPSTTPTKKPTKKPTSSTTKPPAGQPQNLNDACAYDPNQASN